MEAAKLYLLSLAQKEIPPKKASLMLQEQEVVDYWSLTKTSKSPSTREVLEIKPSRIIGA
jgi:hypothetical protein